MTYDQDAWHLAPANDAHAQVFAFVRRVETEQGETFDRLALLESLYDPHSPTGAGDLSAQDRLRNTTENVVASNVDTTTASITTGEVRARYLTDGADWSAQRRAKKLEYYTEGLGKQLGLDRKCKLAAKEFAKKGMGLVKVYRTRWDEPAVDHVRVEDIIVPDGDSRSGAPPLQMHHVQRLYDREQLRAEYPEHADDIDHLSGSRMMTSTALMTASPLLVRNKLTVIESIRLPIGKPPPEVPKGKSKAGSPPRKEVARAKARYVPGRRVVTIETKTLEDEPYHKPFYPFAILVWSERQGSFYPISGAERIAGHQNELNKRGWQINRIIDQNAMITTYVRPADAHLRVQATRIGNIVPIKGDYPQAPILPAVHPEVYQSRRDIKQASFEDFGQNQAASHGTVPAGLETGAAVREVRISQTQRFSPQEANYEQFVLDAYFLLVDVCKDLGALAPTVLESRWRKPIEWADVDMGQVKIQISAASTLPRTAAGREQTVTEWAQAGIISRDSAARLIEHPDLERELSLYTAALESIEQQIEVILDGGIATPEPFDNLKMIEWRATQTFNLIRQAGAPEEVMEALRDYITTASYISAQRQAQNDNAGAAQAGAGAGPVPPGPPDAGPATPAFSAQAMDLRAG